MKLFIDSADVELIKKVAEMGCVDGVTTNPSLLAKQNLPFKEAIVKICKIVNGPISVEVIGSSAKEMIAEAKKLSKIHKNIVIKIPCTAEGMIAIKKLSRLKIATNCTLVFSLTQALLCAKAGATFVSPFVGRLDDEGQDGMALVDEIIQMYQNYKFKTQVLVASVRKLEHIELAALLGADACTIPPQLFEEMIKHYKTDEGIQKFLEDWKKVKEAKI